MAGVRVFVAVTMLMACGLWVSSEDSKTLVEVRIAGEGEVGGELELIRSDGTVLRRVTGLGEPIWLSATPTGTYLVVDRSLRRVVEVDFDGRVHWSWTSSDPKTNPISANPTGDGNILVALGSKGAIELDPSGEIVWRSPPLDHFVTAAVRLPNGSTLLTVSHLEHSLFIVGRDNRTTTELDPPPSQGHGFWTRCSPAIGDAAEMLLWDPNWTEVFLVTVAGGRIAVVDVAPIERAVAFAGNRSRGFVAAADLELEITLWLSPEIQTRLATDYVPAGLAPGPEPGQWVIAHQRLGNASWPETKPQPEPDPLVRWWALVPWLVIGLGCGAALHRLARTTNEDITDHWPQTGEPVAAQPPRRGLQVAAPVLTLGGLLLTWAGVHMMRYDLDSSWLAALATGAITAAMAIEGWRRGVLRRPDPFWAATVTRSFLPTDRPTTIGLTVLAAGAMALAVWRSVSPPAAGQLGLWLGLLIVALSLAALPAQPRRTRRPGVDRQFWLAMALPVSVAAVTTLWRLRDLPVALHFDHVYYAASALDLFEGRFDDPWQFGFVPGPLVGLVPPMIGLLLAGPGELGFRLGSALFGISGVVAVGLLGRAYRDRRTGVFAALFLAGSVPFIHFSRTGANGDAATAATWTLALFAIAMRTGRTGWWILTGMAAGFSCYLWPGARVGIVACVIGGLFLVLRSPRRLIPRWREPLAMVVVIAVWLAPLVPLWIEDTASFFPRAEESLEVFKPSTGIRADRLAESFGDPLVRSFGWFFVLPDSSTHGTLTPGCSEFESTLLAVGLVILLVEGFSLNVVLAVYLFLVMLVLGAFGANPPWYTRLVPSMPVAAVLMARTVVGSLDLAAFRSRHVQRAILLAAVVMVLVAGPVANFVAYSTAETRGESVPVLDDMTVVGRRLRELGPDSHHYLVITDNTEWSCDGTRRNGQFGSLLPYIWDLHVSEIRKLEEVLPLPTDEAAALVLQHDRIDVDLATLEAWYPDLHFEVLHDRRGQPRAGLVIIDRTTAAEPHRPAGEHPSNE